MSLVILTKKAPYNTLCRKQSRNLPRYRPMPKQGCAAKLMRYRNRRVTHEHPKKEKTC